MGSKVGFLLFSSRLLLKTLSSKAKTRELEEMRGNFAPGGEM